MQSGHVQILRDFPSSREPGPRTVRIYTPAAYDREPGRRFGVLYMQDGQNVFAHPESARFHTWMANVAIEQLAASGRTEPWIIVGVDHSPDRFGDYTPWDDHVSRVTAHGERYSRFLVEELKPFVDSHYRTRSEPEWTAVAGSSLGGLISLYLGWSRPHVFGRIGGFSPSVMWSHGLLFQHWRAHSGRWTKVYLDAGADERIFVDGRHLDYGNSTRAFHDHLRGLGYAHHELQLVLEPGGQHYESDWQRRFPAAMSWLLAP